MSGDEHDQVPVVDLDELTDDQHDRDVTAWRAGPSSRPRGRAEERGPPAACRQTISARSFRVHTWLARYRAEGIAGLEDRSHRPASCPHHTADDVEAAVRDLRTKHPRWGPQRAA